MILPGASTLFFVNDQGVAITCKHVASLVQAADNMNRQYGQFREEKKALANNQHYKNALKKLESKYQYKQETTIQLKNNFLNCVDRFSELTCFFHPTLDLAILVFKGFDSINYQSHAIFVKDETTIKQGKIPSCRIGFPFPEIQ